MTDHGGKTHITIPLPTVRPIRADPRWFPVGDGWPPQLYPSGFLRSLDITVTAATEATYERPHAAVERTRSRRALAGSHRSKRYAVRRRGPSGRPAWQDDAPFGKITGYDLFAVNKFGKAA